MRKLWGGAFGQGSDELVDQFGQSIDSDLRFWREDVVGSIAHAKMLGKQGIITHDEAAALVKGLDQILEEGPDKLPKNVEDIHTAVEVRLGEIVGDVAGKLHTARSRNDQVATDTRLYLRNVFSSLAQSVKEIQGVLLELAEKHKDDIMPGYTHQQRAQPYTLGYHLMAYFWAFQRHGWRCDRLLEVLNYCPLGSAALAGTGFPIDRKLTAEELGFSAPVPNALDATSDRSFILDAHHLCALIMIELSRASQELVLWSGREFGFVSLSDTVTTGSSIMPQKRNPDMAELIRGRSGRAVGNWVACATMMKALPLGYNRDTQDDKPGLFESIDLTSDSLGLVKLMWESASWQTGHMAEVTFGDFSTATDLADYLAAQGMPFRQAHEVVGQVVRGCEERSLTLEQLDAETLSQIAPDVPEGALEVLQAEGSVRRRESLGGPGSKAMQTQLERAKQLHMGTGFVEIA